MSKKLEDSTLEEIKAQMSIYQTLYYKKKPRRPRICRENQGER